MSHFARNIRPYIDAELSAASRLEAIGDAAGAFSHLERAHILGQASTFEHVRVHLKMFGWGRRRRNYRECAGQLVRIAGALTKTVLGWVPHGNTGGANVSPIEPMSVPADLQAIIDTARRP